MLGEEDGEEEGPAADGARVAIGADTVVAEEVDDRGGGYAAEPGKEAEAFEPGADGVGAVGGWTLHLDRDLECVGSQLDPIIDEECNGGQRPDDREEG